MGINEHTSYVVIPELFPEDLNRSFAIVRCLVLTISYIFIYFLHMFPLLSWTAD